MNQSPEIVACRQATLEFIPSIAVQMGNGSSRKTHQMPIYEFESPEGTKYYGEGASPQEAFGAAQERSPAELAAMRTRQSVRHGAPEPQIEIPEAARAVQRGEYGPLIESAGESVGELASTVMPGLSAIGSAIAPTATAESMFAAEPDAAKRRALEKQYREASPRGQREILKLFNEQQGKIAEERRAVEREAAERGETQKRRADWLAENADAIKSLRPEWQQQIHAAGSLPEAQEMFNRGMEARRQAGMTLAERYPASVLAGETAAVLGDIYAPAKMISGRARKLGQASEEAEKAYLKAYGPGARSSKGTAAEADLRRSMLEERQALPRLSMGEVGVGTALPYVAGNVPNAIDMLMGMLSDDPAAHEKAQRAFDSATDPMQFLRSLGVGLGATAAGTVLGGVKRDFESEQARAKGLLKQFSARDEATRRAAEARAAARQRPKPSPALAESLRAAEPTAALQPGGANNPLSDISHPFYGN